VALKSLIQRNMPGDECAMQALIQINMRPAPLCDAFREFEVQ
jgi:hypothetical protein